VRRFGCKLEFVSNRSSEGSQFCKGFGGVGGFLRYKCDFLEVTFAVSVTFAGSVPFAECASARS